MTRTRRHRAAVYIAFTLCVYCVNGACGNSSQQAHSSATGSATATGGAAGSPTTGTTATLTGGTPAAATDNAHDANITPPPPGTLRWATRAAEVPADRLAALLRRNEDPSVSLPETLLAARIALWKPLPVGDRVARWANLFVSRTDNTYCFGPKPGGYVADGLLVQDYKLDCVSLFYRCTELARAESPRDAILLALTTRFAGGVPTSVVQPSGAVDYDDPSHLDYSEDFAAAGHWGRDVTRDVGDAVLDAAGTSRYPAGTRWFIPSHRIRYDRLRDGDLLLYVLDENHVKAQTLRRDYGLLVGHQAMANVQGGEVIQIHAAQSPIAGVYAGNRVVRLPLRTYLQRVERFKGIMVVRLESDAAR